MDAADRLRGLIERRISRRRILKAGVAAGLGIAGLSAAACKGDERGDVASGRERFRPR